MVKTPFFNENGLKKGAWSTEEDYKLKSYIKRYGHWNWRELPKFAGLARCGKSCRLRWMNYLRPNIKRGDYSEEEENLIIKLHKQLGNRYMSGSNAGTLLPYTRRIIYECIEVPYSVTEK